MGWGKHHPVDLVPCEGLTLREVAMGLNVMSDPLQCRVEDLTAWGMTVEREPVGVHLSQSRFQIPTLQRGKAWGWVAGLDHPWTGEAKALLQLA